MITTKQKIRRILGKKVQAIFERSETSSPSGDDLEALQVIARTLTILDAKHGKEIPPPKPDDSLTKAESKSLVDFVTKK